MKEGIVLIVLLLLFSNTSFAFQKRYIGEIDKDYFDRLLNEVDEEYNFTPYISSIIVKDFGNFWRWCGAIPQKSRKILLNANPSCNKYGMDYKSNLIHEVRHVYWFHKMKSKDRLIYCKNKGLGYNYECWEAYADDFNFITKKSIS